MNSDYSLYDLIRAYQYLYYVMAVSLISDYEYDRLQHQYETETGEQVPVGSDSERDYTPAEKALAKDLEKRA